MNKEGKIIREQYSTAVTVQNENEEVRSIHWTKCTQKSKKSIGHSRRMYTTTWIAQVYTHLLDALYTSW